MVYWLCTSAITAIVKLIRRIADDYVKLHISKELLGVVCVDEHVCILFCLGAAVVDRLGCAAVFAFAVFPGVTAVCVEDIAALAIELRDAVSPVGPFGTIEGTASEIGRELRDCDAEDLVVQYVVDAMLRIGNQIAQAMVQTLDDFTEEDTAFGEGVEECRVRAREEVLRQEVEHTIGQFRRGEHFVVAQIGNAVEDIGVVVTVLHRQQH